MAKLTYLDPNEDAPKIVWQGVTFIAHKPVEVDEAKHAELVSMAKTHPYFKVEEPKAKAKHKAEPEAEPEDEPEAEAGKPHWDEEPEDTPKPRAKRHKKDAW